MYYNYYYVKNNLDLKNENERTILLIEYLHMNFSCIVCFVSFNGDDVLKFEVFYENYRCDNNLVVQSCMLHRPNTSLYTFVLRQGYE